CECNLGDNIPLAHITPKAVIRHRNINTISSSKIIIFNMHTVQILCAGIDRATIGSTVIGKGTKIDNLVHIGHNCQIGPGNLIVAQTGISGSTTSGPNVTFGGQTGTVGHITIGGNSVFAARSGIIGNTPEGVFYAGFPARPHQEWLRMQAHLQKITDMAKKVKQLEKKLAALEKKE
ncbi:MAG: hypothetical protein IIW84_07410, partial [Selenomonadaceae bacterium]|nr:hypothetical protein [Selenomonadaceae bacterium]